jgi:hypothetical protein
MTNINQDLPESGEFIAGDTFIGWAHVEADDGTDYDLTPVTGATFTLSRERGEVPVLTKTLGDGISKHDVAGGMLRIVLSAADTAGLDGLYHHETKIVESGLTATIANGSLMVSESST